MADCIFECGLPFALTAKPAFQKMLHVICNSKLGNYVPPAPTTVATKLLRNAKRKVEEALGGLHKDYPIYGYTLCSDGWSDRRNRRAQLRWGLATT